MKINPIHSMNANPYKQVAKDEPGQAAKKKERDQLEISTEAQKLLDTERTDREKKVQKLKHLIEIGKYEIDYKKTAEKLLDYWKNKE